MYITLLIRASPYCSFQRSSNISAFVKSVYTVYCQVLGGMCVTYRRVMEWMTEFIDTL
jgi:hypothetical protein